MGPDGLEPSTPRLSSACSNQLSYEPRVKWHSDREWFSALLRQAYGGHQPSLASGLPAVAPQERRLVEPTRFELVTPCLQSRCSTN